MISESDLHFINSTTWSTYPDLVVRFLQSIYGQLKYSLPVSASLIIYLISLTSSTVSEWVSCKWRLILLIDLSQNTQVCFDAITNCTK